jgi:hypothetical protein
MRIELVFDRDCPNAGEARANLRAALEAVGGSLSWSEWERGDPEAPPYVARFGSPTVLVDERPVGGIDPSMGACCRVYAEGDRLGRAPSVESIVALMRETIA